MTIKIADATWLNGDVTMLLHNEATGQSLDVDSDVLELLDGLVSWIMTTSWPQVEVAVEFEDGEEASATLSLVCPGCNGLDTVVARDVLIADRHCYSAEPTWLAGKRFESHLAKKGREVEPVTVRFGEAHGDEESLAYVCADHQGGCGRPLSLPDYIREAY